MASWIDFLKDKNEDTVYPVGITSGIFFPNGEKLSIWTNNTTEKISNIGDTIECSITTDQWQLDDTINGVQTYSAIINEVIPDSFRYIWPSISSNGYADSARPAVDRRYIWSTITNSESRNNTFELELVNNANKYVRDVIIDINIPFMFGVIATGRPPYTVHLSITNLSSYERIIKEA